MSCNNVTNVESTNQIEQETRKQDNLYNSWATDRSQEVADFVITQDAFIEELESVTYTLENNFLRIILPNNIQEGEIVLLTEDTLRIKWNDSRETVTYLSYFDGYEFSKEMIVQTLNYYADNYNSLNNENKLYAYNLEELSPQLPVMKNIICDTEDEQLLETFLNMLIKSKNSVDELPGDILAEIFICNSTLTTKSLEKFGEKYLINQLEFGFLNVTFENETNITNFESLKKEIEILSTRF